MGKPSGQMVLGLILAACGNWIVAVASDPPTRNEAPILRPELRWETTATNLKYVLILHSADPGTCEKALPPQPLTTPAPLTDGADLTARMTVSFVIGTDGMVYSALILKSAGGRRDQAVLNTVRSWRYRPALCNGAPSETEARVEFSTRRRMPGLE